MKHLLRLLVALLATSGVAPASAPKMKADPEQDVESLLNWLRSRGGYLHPNVEIRHAEGGWGTFATGAIPSGQSILVVPRNCLLGSKRGFSHELCGTTANLLDQIALGSDSEFEPFANYLLFHADVEAVPSFWSREGKEALHELTHEKEELEIPPYVPLEGSVQGDYQEECGSAIRSPAGLRAYALLLQRGWDDLFIPVYDLLNHRNGWWLNTESDTVHGKGDVMVRAKRDIAAGEEIYGSYNHCEDCGARIEEYGTPEILRDYGFVEDYPRKWIIGEDLSFVVDQGAEGLEVTWMEEPTFEGINFLATQYERLVGLELDGEGVPPKEFGVVTKYREALIEATRMGVEAASVNSGCMDSEGNVKGTCSFSSLRYDKLNFVPDELNYNEYTCQMEGGLFTFPGYDRELDFVESPYQEIDFLTDHSNKDTCFELDDIVQICGSYRPHYHEMVVHYPARFIETVKRVLWVGGGDSMLLHEILKYPSLELAVGLELDQLVTRSSFKHFGTQPHWSDPRVEWWYGDATKSILMLPEDYFGSFDLVLVDLSETVMSFQVTNELDVFSALALLLKPNGVFVKNELYLEKMSTMFHHVTQMHYYDVPVICSQCLIFGSNGVDFLTAPTYDHDVQSLFFQQDSYHQHPFKDIHDYNRNHTVADQVCHRPFTPLHDEPQRSPGVLMILEAEGAVFQTSQIQTLLSDVLGDVGAPVLHSAERDSSALLLVTRAGYVLARAHPARAYVALDVHLWSDFSLHRRLETALAVALGAQTSSYRVVAGGMLGAPAEGRGPQAQQSSCEPPPGEWGSGSPAVVLAETVGLIDEDEPVVAVVCGFGSCFAAYEARKKPVRVLELSPCNYLADIEVEDYASQMLRCEEDIWNTLQDSILFLEAKIRAVIFDQGAPYIMGQIMHRIFDTQANQDEMFEDDFMASALGPEEWKTNLLERFRAKIMHEPVFRAHVLFGSLELVVVSSGDALFFQNLLRVNRAISAATNLPAEVKLVKGGFWSYQENFVPSQFFLPKDYDQTSPLAQYRSQTPLANQTVVQLEADSPSSAAYVRTALDETLASLSLEATAGEFADLGRGVLFSRLWTGGHAVLLWDGGGHLDVNSYAPNDEENEFLGEFLRRLPAFAVSLRDEQPRGSGRVVNHEEDINRESDPHWA